LIAAARKEAEAAQRDPEKLEITVSIPDDLAELDGLRSLGVSRVLVPAIRGARFNPPMRGPEDLANWAETIKRYAAV
jgi:hypothetical protein